MKTPMGKSLPFTLFGVMNPCYLHDVREMTRTDDTTDTLSMYGDSLCYKIPLPPSSGVAIFGAKVRVIAG
jgi:hypothetical protein